MTVASNDLLVGPVTPTVGTTLISLDFYFESASDLEVYKSGSNTPLTITTDYTVSLPSAVGATDGSISLVVAANGTDRYSIYLKQPLQRSADLQFRGDLRSPVLNVELDRLWRAVQGINTALDRVFRFSQTSDVPAPLDAETAASRADKIIGFSADGTGLALIVTPNELATLAGLTSEIAVIGGLETEITTLGALGTEISGVYAIRNDVSTVAGIAGNVTTVAGISANVGTVAGIAANVTTVAGLDTEIAALAAITADISAVAAIDTEVGTVAGDSADIATLAGISADISALANATGGNIAGAWNFTGTFEVTGVFVVSTEAINWTGSVTLDPANGLVQEITLTGNVTAVTDNLADGESVILHIDDGTAYTITWPTITWVSGDGVAPTLQATADTVVSIWKVGATLYGFASNGA
jgi:hypothetical protein